MSDNERSILGSDGKAYELGPYLGAGLLGTVYLGSRQGDNGKVAIKIPAPNLDSKNLALFDDEYQTLARIKTVYDALPGSIPNVPLAYQGKLQDSTQNALILEFVGEDALLGSILNQQKDDLMREILALRAAQQYATLLFVLHKKVGWTCQDRKTADIRWVMPSNKRVDEGRLVVLDWNVIHKELDRIPEDIFLFGSLWYQLMVGKYPPPDPSPLDDALWRDGAVSMGARRILCNALSTSPEERYSDVIKLGEDIKRQLGLYADATLRHKALDSFDAVLVKDTQFKKILQDPQSAGLEPNLDLDAEWDALVFLDLVFRAGASDLGRKRSECVELVRSQGQRLSASIAHYFRLGESTKGEKVAALSAQVAQKTRNAKLALRVVRWCLCWKFFAAALQEISSDPGNAQQKMHNLTNARKQLSDWMDQLQDLTEKPVFEKAEWRSLTQKLDQILQLIPEKSRNVLADLNQELLAYQHLVAADEARLRNDYDEAIDNLRQARQAGDQLADEDYKAKLKKTLPDFDLKERQYTSQKEKQKFLEQLKGKLTPGMVLGKPDYISLLLHRDLQEFRGSVVDDDLAEAGQWLEPLLRLYLCAERDEWEGIVKEAGALLQLSSVSAPTIVKTEAIKYLAKVREKADAISQVATEQFVSMDMVNTASYFYNLLRNNQPVIDIQE